MAHPLVSVIIPIYRTVAYLSRCLESLRAQTYREWEAICVDDGSPDESIKILEAYALRDKRIRVFRQENRGVSAARNAGLDQVGGAYFCMVDSDDALEPDYLAELMEPVLKS
ncbi:MAG: glycosyltransferase family 2 protein [Akkermansia sp.]